MYNESITKECSACEYHTTEQCDADMVASACKLRGTWCSNVHKCEYRIGLKHEKDEDDTRVAEQHQ